MFSINKIVKSNRYNEMCRVLNSKLSRSPRGSRATISARAGINYNDAFFAGIFTLVLIACFSLEVQAVQPQADPANKVFKQLNFNQYQNEISLKEITSSATVDLPIDSTSKLAGLDEYRYLTNQQYDRNPQSLYRELGTADQLILPKGTNSIMPKQTFSSLGHCRESQCYKYSRTKLEKQLEEVKYAKSQGCFDAPVLDAREVGGGKWVIALKSGEVKKCEGALGSGQCSTLGKIKHSSLEHVAISPSGLKVGFAGDGVFGFADFEEDEEFSDDHVGGKFMALTWSVPQDGEIRQGEQFLVAAADGDIFLYNPRAKDVRKRIEKYAGHSSVPSALAFLPDGTVFLSGDWQGTLAATALYDEGMMSEMEYQKDYMRGRVFQSKATRKVASRKGSESISNIAMVPGGDLFVTGGVNGSVELWEIKGLKQSDVKKQSPAEILGIAVNEAGDSFATLNRRGMIDIWAIEAGDVVLGIEGRKKLAFKKQIGGGGMKKLLTYNNSGHLSGLTEQGCIVEK